MMRLILMVFALALAALNGPVLAQERHSTDCIPDSGCAKGEFPPKCCKKPPCGLFRALQVSRAYRQHRLQRRATAADNRSGKFRSIAKEDFDKAQSQFAPCPYEPDYRAPPHLEPALKNDCLVSVWYEGKPQESIFQGEAVTEINACTEVIEAVYEYATAQQPFCESRKKGSEGGDAERLQAELDGYQAQIDWLEQELWQYWNACTIVFSADTARRVAEEGIDALRDAKPFESADTDELTPLTPSPPKKASRGGKKRR